MTKLDEIVERQNDYARRQGGIYTLNEADETYNDMNREQIAAFKEKHGAEFLGNINFYGDDRAAVVAGEKNVYEEYVGQMVYNFECDFCVPCADEALAEIIRAWNTPGRPLALSEITHITDKIEALGGINLIWF